MNLALFTASMLQTWTVVVCANPEPQVFAYSRSAVHQQAIQSLSEVQFKMFQKLKGTGPSSFDRSFPHIIPASNGVHTKAPTHLSSHSVRRDMVYPFNCLLRFWEHFTDLHINSLEAPRP